MGSLFEAIEAEEAEVPERVEQLEARLAELTEGLEAERERLSRPVITPETVGELLARMTDDSAVDEPVRQTPSVGDGSPFEGAERRVARVLSVPKWQPGMETSALPQIYQDILEVAPKPSSNSAPSPATDTQRPFHLSHRPRTRTALPHP
ncbi:hypothetical protein ACWDBO_47995 [Streptomyces mirabilis]|uniref:hypothetical protein n=1 Tax=Streptomyces TaxID=1883 RepID=UPI0029B7B55B|nr:hypothetical protein [Streptomyces sp. AK02-04a]MDX3763150.1 hypothetical protein [Streptomyces sp. AK02-04a]